MGITWGPRAYSLLNGVFCVYKPGGVPCFQVIKAIQNNLAKDLNALPCYSYESIKEDKETKSMVLTTPEPSSLSIQNHRLVLGNRYISSDFDIKYVSNLCKHSAGVLVMGIGTKTNYLYKIAAARYLRVYHVQGTFGVATSNYSPKGQVLYRTTYHHITKLLLDKACAASQSTHQRHMFEYAGVNPESQKAYELASVGIVRPQSKETPPLLYGIKCIDFNLPDFTLEIHSINENSDFLKALIHDIGIKLKSTAVCSSIRRIRYGYFTLDHCLLRADWHFEQILSNIRLCKQLLTDKKLITAQNVKPSKLLSGNDVKLLDKNNKVVSDSDSKFLAGSYSELFTDDNLISDKNGELISDNGTKLTGDNDGESRKNDEMMDDNKYCRENESDIFNPDYERFDGVDKKTIVMKKKN